jgi:hypothetical protein
LILYKKFKELGIDLFWRSRRKEEEDDDDDDGRDDG